MDSIPKNEILQFPEDALQAVRREYDLDKPGRIIQAIDLLDAWVKKQNHFTRTDFPRDYLERQIIFCKGSVERTKQKLERNCTLKKIVPVLYETINFKTDYKDSNILLDAVLPKLTDDYYRIYVLRNIGQRFINGLTDYFRFVFSMAEYVVRHDYTKGIIVILDYTDTNQYELIKAIDIVEFRQAVNMLIEGYGMKIKSIHVITTSKTTDTVITIFKQVLSAKLGKRIQVHKNYESLHSFVSKDVLPAELGGYERSLSELHDFFHSTYVEQVNIFFHSNINRQTAEEKISVTYLQLWLDILSSDEHQEYLKERRNFKTNENFRQTDKLNEEYMGMPGTFRNLSLD